MLVGTVAKREADLSMNLALTGAREKVIDYSVAYIGWTHHRSISFTSPPLMLHSPDEPLTFSVSSPLPLPQVCQNWSNSRYFVPLPTICCSGTASIGLIKHKLGFYFWLSCFSWVRILCCCCCGIVLNPKILFQVLSWVSSESVEETRKSFNDKVSSLKIASWTPTRSILASASTQSIILILRSSSYCWSTAFIKHTDS